MLLDFILIILSIKKKIIQHLLSSARRVVADDLRKIAFTTAIREKRCAIFVDFNWYLVLKVKYCFCVHVIKRVILFARGKLYIISEQ